MDVGQYYGFDKTFRDPDTSYPHKNNDLVVKEQFKKGTSDTDENWVQMYKNLEPFSKNSVHELFATDKLEVENDGKSLCTRRNKLQFFWNSENQKRTI